MTKVTKKPTTKTTFFENVEKLLFSDEKIIFKQNHTYNKVAISNFGIYCYEKNHLRNKSSIVFYPKAQIESVSYNKQGWFVESWLIEISICARISSFEDKQERRPVKIIIKDNRKNQAETLFHHCKALIT